jgi:hypothetical protein
MIKINIFIKFDSKDQWLCCYNPWNFDMFEGYTCWPYALGHVNGKASTLDRPASEKNGCCPLTLKPISLCDTIKKMLMGPSRIDG